MTARSLPVLVAAAWLLAVIAPIGLLLNARVPSTLTTPLAPPADRQAVPIELSYLDYPNRPGTHVAAATLHFKRADTLAAHRRLDIVVANYETAPRLVRGRLAIDGTNCVYETRGGASFPNNAPIAFLRQAPCERMIGSPTGTMRLEVTFEGPGRLAIWTYRVNAGDTDREVIYVGDPVNVDSGTACEVQAGYVEEFGGMRRIVLLAYVWQIRNGDTRWIWFTVAGCAVVLLTASLLMPTSVRARAAAARTIGGAAATALAIGVLYVVLVPPFQGPDEPSHFLGYGHVTGNASLRPAAEAWARLMHFHRIRFHPDEGFRPADIGQPQATTWDAMVITDFTRSSAPVRLWQALAPTLAQKSIPLQLLLLRLANVGVFALAVACGAAGLWMGGLRAPLAIVALPLLVPMIPFLGMHVSNYSTAVAGYVVIASGTAMLGLRGRAPHLAGWYLGIGLAVALASTRSAVPMLAFAAALVAGRLVLVRSGETPRGRLVSAAVFWSGLSSGVLLFVWFLTSVNALQLLGEVAAFHDSLGAALSRVMRHPWLAAGAVLITGIALEAMAGAAVAAAERTRASAGRWLRPITIVLGIAVVAVLFLSTVVPLPILHAGTRGVTSPVTYVREAVLSAATIFRLDGHDLLMSATFWAGIGWLDTYPPFVIPLLCAMSGLLLARGLWTAELRRRAWLLLAGGAALGTVGIYAFAALKASPDVHGRYFMGAYLAALYVIWITGLGKQDGEAPTRGAVLTFAAAIVHGVTLTTVLTRYF